MSDVTLSIGGRNYTVSCADGQEDHVRHLASVIDGKLSAMGNNLSSNDAKNLLFNRKEFSTFKAALEPDANYLVDESEQLYTELHRDNSFRTQFDKKNFLETILESPNWRDRLALN